MTRRWSILSALMATALLLFCLPGLMRQQWSHPGRTDDRLKPAPSRTMVVWVTSWMEEDRKLITSLCGAFEKQRPGLRIFLRRTDASELMAPEAVLPDVVLHTTGDVLAPENVLLPLTSPEGVGEGLLAAGMHQGSLYGVPLWYAPQMLSVPKAWFRQEDAPGRATTPAGQAYFTLATPVPEKLDEPITLEDVPWQKVLECGHVVAENGVGFAQWLLHSPASLHQEMIRLEPALRKPEAGEAAVCSLATHLAREQEAMGLLLPPPTAQRVRWLSLCRGSEDAHAFTAFLLGQEAQQAAAAAQLMPAVEAAVPEHSWQAQMASGGAAFLPCAFTMESAAMDQLCMEDFRRGADPVATLLKLR